MKDGEFKGRTAVITGAASGMGFVASKELAKRGANVVMCDVNADALAACGKEAEALGGCVRTVVADVRSYADAEAAARTAVEAFGSIDILICFAGGAESRILSSPHRFFEQPIEVLDWGIDVNLKGPIYFSRACMPQMVKQRRGVIVCLGSVVGVEGDSVCTMYGAAKSGLFGFVKGLAKAGGEYGVRAVCVSPGPVMTRPGMASMATLIGRGAEPIEVVDYILYLCSDAAGFITGTNHVVDCGHLCMTSEMMVRK